MKLAIHQPQYLPWLGYLAKWAAADAFVFLDTVQYEKNGWQNRNRIKTAAGPRWVTVPVHARLGTPSGGLAAGGGEPVRGGSPRGPLGAHPRGPRTTGPPGRPRPLPGARLGGGRQDATG